MNQELAQETIDNDDAPITHRARLVIIRWSCPELRGLLNFEIKDLDAGTSILELDVDYAAFMQCLTRFTDDPEHWRDAVEDNMQLGRLDVAGKLQESKIVEFKMPGDIKDEKEKKTLP